MTFKYLLIFFLSLSFIMGCASVAQKKPDIYEIKVEEFSSSVKLLLSDINFLKEEILKVNAKRPSIQRIISEADSLWFKGDVVGANLELERALRISKDESALYLRLAHLRLEQELYKESRAFAARGLLNDRISSWEILLLNIYTKKQI